MFETGGIIGILMFLLPMGVLAGFAMAWGGHRYFGLALLWGIFSLISWFFLGLERDRASAGLSAVLYLFFMLPIGVVLLVFTLRKFSRPGGAK